MATSTTVWWPMTTIACDSASTGRNTSPIQRFGFVCMGTSLEDAEIATEKIVVEQQLNET